MAKVAIKYDNIVPYGGIFYAMNEFRRTGLGKLGLSGKILGSFFSFIVFCIFAL